MWTKFVTLLVVIAIAWGESVTRLIPRAADDYSKAVRNEGLVHDLTLPSRTGAAFMKAVRHLESDTEMIESAEKLRRGFVEFNLFDLLNTQPDNGEFDCAYGFYPTRVTFTLNQCLPDPLFQFGSIFVTADNAGVVRILGYNDKTCSSRPQKQKIDLSKIVPCANGVKVEVTEKRTPHGMGLSERWYFTKDCTHHHNDIFWGDNTCWNDPNAGSSYVTLCSSGTVYSYPNSNCIYTSAGYWFDNVQSYIGYDSCAKDGSHYVQSVCGGQMN